jgi:phosphatidylinositol-3-phosphatase
MENRFPSCLQLHWQNRTPSGKKTHMNNVLLRQPALHVLLFMLSMKALPQAPAPSHVVIVVEENRDYSQVIGAAAAPYINSLSADSDAALFTQSYAIMHPSQPNYLCLFSGSDQGITNDSLPKSLPFSKDNLGGLLIKAGKTFVGYSEDLPQAGFEGEKSGEYARKHNPWANWQNATSCVVPASSNQPFSAFPTNHDSLPAVAFVCPNLNHDMHNGTDPTTITRADTWLHDHMDGYIQWAKKNNSLLILTFDEGKEKGDNRIVTIFIGAMAKHGNYSEKIDHYSVLRTVEDMFGLSHAGNSASATPIINCWKGKTAAINFSAASMPKPSYQSRFLNPLNISLDMRNPDNLRPVIFDVLGRYTVVPVHAGHGIHSLIHFTPGFPAK